ncbi:cAMP-dependent protein kinase catalytic subunit gamma-like [Galendromus occidentalis]|uniref:cAMP-dependent protein kinase catalytic subunit gamma-like n=1 Tax=Galendromus occidentalis TaxID=34638 RepID=A0AAJ6VZ65_9ACAR|nr:cAMP-dependent protein kinase catalytic subunit gamma-like [Galendromus occidentalis]
MGNGSSVRNLGQSLARFSRWSTRALTCGSSSVVRSRDGSSDVDYEDHLRRLGTANDRMKQYWKNDGCPKAKLKHFRNLGCLARGTFGIVHKVQHLRTRKEFALKRQFKEILRRKNNQTRPGVERRLQWAAKNRFIVGLEYAFQDSQNLYLVMEYAPYGDLAEAVSRSPLPEKQTRLASAQIVLGLEFLFASGICHRDLKPLNIFIFERGILKIGDFGLAKAMKKGELTHTMLGTERYMAPEMFSSMGYGTAIDLWALGVLIFECLYDENPFTDEQRKQLQCKEPDRKVSPGFPSDVPRDSPNRDFLCGLLELDPKRRLGVGGQDFRALKEHAFFRGISFERVYSHELTINVRVEPVKPKEPTQEDREWPQFDDNYDPEEFPLFD